jgi:signal transduction histidine kinase
MRLRREPLAPEQRYAVAIVGILLLILALVFSLTWQAWRAARAQRAMSDAAIADQASFAASTYRTRVNGQVFTALTNAFLPVAALRGREPPDDAARMVMAVIDSLFRCDCAPIIAARYAFRLDLRSGDLQTAGPVSPAAGERRWLAAQVGAHARETYDHAWPFGTTALERDEALQFVAYTLVQGRDDAPRWAVGFLTDSAGMARDVFGLQYRHAPLLTNARFDTLSRDSTIAIRVATRSERVVYQTVSQFPQRYTGRAVIGPFMGGFTFAVTLDPVTAASILAPSPARLDVPLLGGILVLTGALLACAVVLIWRTTSLARLRADFTSSVSHELRTPLAQIMLFAETMAHGRLASMADYRRESHVILQEGRRLLHLVENVLHFARAERLAMPLTVRPQLLGPIVRGTVHAFAPLAAESDLVIRTAIDDEVGAHVDADAVRRALANLLENALKYDTAGQQIIVGLTLEDGWARIRVDDRGPGVPRGERERIWRPFTRLAREADRGIAGSGIGLAIVRDIVRRHRGRAWVEDSPLGGARFVLEFPAAWRAERGSRHERIATVEPPVAAHRRSR